MTLNQSIVVDSNVFVASWLNWYDQHSRGRSYLDDLDNGVYTAHVPMLVLVEVIASINREARRNRTSVVSTVVETFIDWERDGKIILYPLDRRRLDLSIAVAKRDRLRGADSVIAALSEELNIPLRTFDNEIIERFALASP